MGWTPADRPEVAIDALLPLSGTVPSELAPSRNSTEPEGAKGLATVAGTIRAWAGRGGVGHRRGPTPDQNGVLVAPVTVMLRMCAPAAPMKMSDPPRKRSCTSWP